MPVCAATYKQFTLERLLQSELMLSEWGFGDKIIF